jgi:hypothetical protein
MSYYNGGEDARTSAYNIRQLKMRLTTHGGKIVDLRRHESEAMSKRTELETAHPEWVQHNSRNATGYAIILMAILAVYCLDVMLFGPTAQILSEKAFDDMHIVAKIARFLIPAAVILIEIAVGLQIYSCRKERQDYHKGVGELLIWIMFGISLCVVMPALVVGTNLVQVSLEDNEVSKTGLYWQLVGLVALALAMHLPIIFNGRTAHEAKSYYAFCMKHNTQERIIHSCKNTVDKERNALRTDFEKYYDLLQRHTEAYGSNINPGLFDIATRDAINEIYGREMVVNGNTIYNQEQRRATVNDSHETEPNDHESVNPEESEVHL